MDHKHLTLEQLDRIGVGGVAGPEFRLTIRALLAEPCPECLAAVRQAISLRPAALDDDAYRDIFERRLKLLPPQP